VRAVGVPVLPVPLPGDAISPGTSSCSFANAAAFTTTLLEVALVRPLAVKLTVMLVATLWERLANVAKPFVAVAVKVPCSVPLPALRAAVTTVLLSPLRRLPNASSTRRAGCCANAAPAVAVVEGCVWIVSRLAAAGFTVTPLEVATFKPPLVKSIVIVSAWV
jgi:hypothetical protein